MRLTNIATLFLSVLFVSAQSTESDATATTELFSELAKLPQCATACITKSLTLASCDDPTDFTCLCSDEAFISSSETCILSSCTVKGALASQKWQKKACKVPTRNEAPTTQRVGDALLIIAALCIAGRFSARWWMQNNNLGWDDWTILAAFLLLIPSTIIVKLMLDQGMGQDIWMVPSNGITMMLKYFYVEQYLYQVIVILTKISIILLYLRIFPKEVSKRFQYASGTVIIALILYGVGTIIYIGFECRPISYFWDQWDGEHEGYCVNQQLAVYIISGLNILFDLIVFFLPIPKLLKLQIRSKRRKAGVVLTFLVGLFVTTCSMIRLHTLTNLGSITNATYHYNSIALWSALEGDVGVICACMPALAGPVLYFFRDVLGSRGASTNKSSANKSATASRITGNKSIGRLPSTASTREFEDDAQDHKLGGIEKRVVTSMYNIPYGHSSGDDVELIEQGPGHGRKEQWEHA